MGVGRTATAPLASVAASERDVAPGVSQIIADSDGWKTVAETNEKLTVRPPTEDEEQ
jgi:hypothetical protein